MEQRVKQCYLGLHLSDRQFRLHMAGSCLLIIAARSWRFLRFIQINKQESKPMNLHVMLLTSKYISFLMCFKFNMLLRHGHVIMCVISVK